MDKMQHKGQKSGKKRSKTLFHRIPYYPQALEVAATLEVFYCHTGIPSGYPSIFKCGKVKSDILNRF